MTIEINEDVRERFNAMFEKHQLDVFLWCIQQEIIEKELIPATEKEKAKIELTGEINQQVLEKALEELRKHGYDI